MCKLTPCSGVRLEKGLKLPVSGVGLVELLDVEKKFGVRVLLLRLLSCDVGICSGPLPHSICMLPVDAPELGVWLKMVDLQT